MAEFGWLRAQFRPQGQLRRQGIEQTTARLRQLVDGLEAAVGSGDDVALVRYLGPQLTARMLAAAAGFRRQGVVWRPARSGLRWSPCRRAPDGPGLAWLRLRLEDRTRCEYPEGTVAAPLRTREVDVELDTTGVPWKLCRVVERPGVEDWSGS
ncbi:MAG: hypothetical protein HKL89_06790 [Candidatus Dormibacteraeota bacterium]|nr:hypothetical protein [Candidatus Dormibacteraeota bacterium]